MYVRSEEGGPRSYTNSFISKPLGVDFVVAQLGFLEKSFLPNLSSPR